MNTPIAKSGINLFVFPFTAMSNAADMIVSAQIP